MEINVRIEAPDLSAAILKLAEAITPKTGSAWEDAAEAFRAATVPAEQLATPTAPAPVTLAPTTPAPTAAPAPTAGPSAATAPGNAPAPVPVVPVAVAPSYSMEQIATAGAALVDAGKRDQLLALLSRFGLQAVTQLQPAQYGTFAAELRALGAQI